MKHIDAAETHLSCPYCGSTSFRIPIVYVPHKEKGFLWGVEVPEHFELTCVQCNEPSWAEPHEIRNRNSVWGKVGE